MILIWRAFTIHFSIKQYLPFLPMTADRCPKKGFHVREPCLFNVKNSNNSHGANTARTCKIFVNFKQLSDISTSLSVLLCENKS